MNLSSFYTLVVLPLVLSVCLTVLLSFLFILVRFCRKVEKIALVKSPSDIRVFGPGWIFLKPYRGKVVRVSLLAQHCEVAPFSTPAGKIIIAFRVIDAEKAISVGIQQALFILENADLPEVQKERMRNAGDFGSITSQIRSFVRSLVLITYGEISREHQIKDELSPQDATGRCKGRIEKQLLERGIQLLDISFSSAS